jgi:DNA-binding SARP family transcriptional activator
MPGLSLTLCGRVSVSGDVAQPATSSLSGKCLALLAYVALEPGPHSRDELSALLWGEYPDAKAKASLRQALVHLRDALPNALHVTRTSVELIGTVESDVGSFMQLAKESPAAASELRVSGFLDGLHLRRCPEFDEWADAMRATLTRRYGEVVAAVTRDALARRDWPAAVRFGERWVAAAPVSPTAASALMEAELMTGAPDLALAAFAQFRTRLAEETGESPDATIIAFAERVRTATQTTPRRHQATEEWYASAPSFEGTLVGRRDEWEHLTRLWAKAATGSARVALLEGDVGVGKTRLATDFLRWVTAEGGTVLRGRGYDTRGGVPLGAMIEALRSAIDAPGLAGTDPQWLAEVARVVPELRSRFRALGETPSATAADGWRLFEGVAQLLGALAEEAPVAVFIDDLQWCDADSCNLLNTLVRRLDGLPVLWCLTFSLGSVERDAPAARLVRALRAFSHTQVVSLRPMTEDDVWQLLRGLGRVSAPNGARRLAARIHEVTTGFPFYVIELLKTLFAQGWLTVDAETGEWIVGQQDAGALTAMPTPTVHEAIAERIECLPDELSGVLISIAVSQRGCRTDVLSHVHGISRLRAAFAGDALVERHLASEDDGVYRCAHPFIARVVSDALGTSRRREVHRGLAVASEIAAAEGGAAADPGDVARHAELGGERAMAFRYGMLAAEACEARFASDEALAWLDFASALATSESDTDTVNRTTARLLANADQHAPLTPGPAVSRPESLGVGDLDLPARV